MALPLAQMNTIARNYLTSLINHATFYLINCGKEDNAGLHRERMTARVAQRDRARWMRTENSEFMLGVCVHVFVARF